MAVENVKYDIRISIAPRDNTAENNTADKYDIKIELFSGDKPLNSLSLDYILNKSQKSLVLKLKTALKKRLVQVIDSKGSNNENARLIDQDILGSKSDFLPIINKFKSDFNAAYDTEFSTDDKKVLNNVEDTIKVINAFDKKLEVLEKELEKEMLNVDALDEDDRLTPKGLAIEKTYHTKKINLYKSTLSKFKSSLDELRSSVEIQSQSITNGSVSSRLEVLINKLERDYEIAVNSLNQVDSKLKSINASSTAVLSERDNTKLDNKAKTLTNTEEFLEAKKAQLARDLENNLALYKKEADSKVDLLLNKNKKTKEKLDAIDKELAETESKLESAKLQTKIDKLKAKRSEILGKKEKVTQALEANIAEQDKVVEELNSRVQFLNSQTDFYLQQAMASLLHKVKDEVIEGLDTLTVNDPQAQKFLNTAVNKSKNAILNPDLSKVSSEEIDNKVVENVNKLNVAHSSLSVEDIINGPITPLNKYTVLRDKNGSIINAEQVRKNIAGRQKEEQDRILSELEVPTEKLSASDIKEAILEEARTTVHKNLASTREKELAQRELKEKLKNYGRQVYLEKNSNTTNYILGLDNKVEGVAKRALTADEDILLDDILKRSSIILAAKEVSKPLPGILNEEEQFEYDEIQKEKKITPGLADQSKKLETITKIYESANAQEKAKLTTKFRVRSLNFNLDSLLQDLNNTLNTDLKYRISSMDADNNYHLMIKGLSSSLKKIILDGVNKKLSIEEIKLAISNKIDNTLRLLTVDKDGVILKDKIQEIKAGNRPKIFNDKPLNPEDFTDGDIDLANKVNIATNGQGDAARVFVGLTNQAVYNTFGGDAILYKGPKEPLVVVETEFTENKKLDYGRQNSPVVSVTSVEKNVKNKSRPQCSRWIRHRYILSNELQKEINWAYQYGVGMRSGTSPSNFLVYRGGYNCRHFATAININPEIKKQITEGKKEYEKYLQDYRALKKEINSFNKEEKNFAKETIKKAQNDYKVNLYELKTDINTVLSKNKKLFVADEFTEDVSELSTQLEGTELVESLKNRGLTKDKVSDKDATIVNPRKNRLKNIESNLDTYVKNGTLRTKNLLDTVVENNPENKDKLKQKLQESYTLDTKKPEFLSNIKDYDLLTNITGESKTMFPKAESIYIYLNKYDTLEEALKPVNLLTYDGSQAELISIIKRAYKKVKLPELKTVLKNEILSKSTIDNDTVLDNVRLIVDRKGDIESELLVSNNTRSRVKNLRQSLNNKEVQDILTKNGLNISILDSIKDVDLKNPQQLQEFITKNKDTQPGLVNKVRKSTSTNANLLIDSLLEILDDIIVDDFTLRNIAVEVDSLLFNKPSDLSEKQKALKSEFDNDVEYILKNFIDKNNSIQPYLLDGSVSKKQDVTLGTKKEVYNRLIELVKQRSYVLHHYNRKNRASNFTNTFDLKRDFIVYTDKPYLGDKELSEAKDYYEANLEQNIDIAFNEKNKGITKEALKTPLSKQEISKIKLDTYNSLLKQDYFESRLSKLDDKSVVTNLSKDPIFEDLTNSLTYKHIRRSQKALAKEESKLLNKLKSETTDLKQPVTASLENATALKSTADLNLIKEIAQKKQFADDLDNLVGSLKNKILNNDTIQDKYLDAIDIDIDLGVTKDSINNLKKEYKNNDIYSRIFKDKRFIHFQLMFKDNLILLNDTPTVNKIIEDGLKLNLFVVPEEGSNKSRDKKNTAELERNPESKRKYVKFYDKFGNNVDAFTKLSKLSYFEGKITDEDILLALDLYNNRVNSKLMNVIKNIKLEGTQGDINRLKQYLNNFEKSFEDTFVSELPNYINVVKSKYIDRIKKSIDQYNSLIPEEKAKQDLLNALINRLEELT